MAIHTVDVSQQTDDTPKTQKPSVREEELTDKVNDLQRQLKETRKLERDVQSEMETIKLALAKAMKIIAEMEQSQTIDDAKDLLLPPKDVKVEQLKASVEPAECKTENLQQQPLAKEKDVERVTADLPPVPVTKKTKSSRAGPKNQALFSEKVKQSLEVKVEAEVVKQPEAKPAKNMEKTPAEADSILETVVEALCPSKFPPLATKTSESSPPTKVEFASSDIRYKNKPMEGYRHNPLDGTTLVYPLPRKQPTPVPEPAPGFVVVSKELKQTEYRDLLIVSDIPQKLCGLVIGGGGENVKRMQLNHGVSMKMVKSTTQEECSNMNIRGGNLEKRRAAAREIVESMPAAIEFPAKDHIAHLKKLAKPAFRKLLSPLYVRIKRSTTPDDTITISGRINDCRKTFELLVNDTPLVTQPTKPK